MEVTYLDIANFLSAQNELNQLKLPAKYAVRVARAVRRAREYYADIDEIRKRIISDVGIVEGENLTEEQKRANEEKLPLANEKFNEALKEKVSIDVEPIDVEELDKDVELSINLLDKAFWLFK